MSNAVVGFEAGTVVCWNGAPSDRGIVWVENDGGLVVLWFDDECNCDDIDVEGNTVWRKDPNKSVGQYRFDGVVYSRRGKPLKRQSHYVIATGEVDLTLLAKTRERFERYLKEHK
jgi:hypothetical protein